MKRLMLLVWLVLLVSASGPAMEPEANPYPAVKHGTLYMYNYYISPAPGSTPWAPCWSPDGKWIAVGMQGSIWKVNPDNGQATELTTGQAYASSPDISPDGKWLVYTADEASQRIQLEILNLIAGASHRLTNDNHLYLDPVFSPDGSRLAYVSTQSNGYYNVYIRAIRDGQWAGDPIPVTRDHEYPRDRLYFGPWDMHTQPAWTPDGKELVLVSNRNVPLGSGDLWRVPARAGGMDEATLIFREQTLYRTRPHVSRDGKVILYSSMAGGADQFNNLYTLPINGGSPYKLTFGSYDHFHPRWSPDGEWIAFISNEAGLPQLGLLETYGGMQKKVVITNRQWRRPMGRLQVRVVEGSTGQLTAARILGLAPNGRFYPPVDTYARIGVNGRHYFHTQGEFTVDVPPGKMILEAVKGFEFQPGKQEITIRPHETVSTTLTLERLADFPAKGWYSGSTHVHMNYGGNLHNTPQNTAEMANAEDLHFVHAMVANKDNRVLDWQYFRPGGGEYPVEHPIAGVKIHIGEEYRPAFLGHTFLIGLRSHLISPFTASYEGTAIDSIYPNNTDIFRKAKGQGAVTGYVHPFGDTDPLESGLGAKGFAVDAVLGALDALEWSGAVQAEMGVWQREMNNDVALTPTGGEDSINDLQRCRTVGGIRTYVHLDDPFSVESWIEGLRQGHTFFSTGPLLDFHVNGKLPGDQLHLPTTGGTVTLEGSVVSVGQLSKVVIYCRQGILREIPLDAGGNGAHFREVVPLTDSNWFSLSAEGPYYPPLDAKYALAGTNSVRVYVGERKIRSRPDAEYFLRWIDLLKQQTEKWPWWRSPAEKEHILAQYEEARRIYRRFIDEAQQQDLLY